MDHRPKKRFGQNFLRDPNIVQRIIDAAALSPEDAVVEIGPGLGALTDQVLPRVRQMHIMEVDRDLAEQWQLREETHLQVHVGDALSMVWEEVLPEPPYKLVANLPYNISSQVVFKVLDHKHLFKRLVLMFQKEVGDRLCAEPGTKDYGILSVLCRLWFDVSRVVLVPPGAFFPPPKVTSAVLLFEPLERPRVEVVDEALFRRVVKGAFAQRRKTLRNSLAGSGLPTEGVDDIFSAAGIDPRRRGETLNLEEFARLTEGFRQSSNI